MQWQHGVRHWHPPNLSSPLMALKYNQGLRNRMDDGVGGAGGPLVSGAVGLLGGALVRDLIAWWRGAAKDSAEVDKIHNDAIDAYLRTLISGYENRVADLTAEVQSLREEVKALRIELDNSRANAYGAL